MRSLTFMCFLDDWLKAIRHLIRTAFRVLLDFLRLVLIDVPVPERRGG